MHTVYFSLGSNLGHKHFFLQKAILLMQEHLGVVQKVSPVYDSPAWGFSGDDFLNACISLETHKSPEEVLSAVLFIEKQLGRVRSLESGYQPRTIDIDILYYDNLHLKGDDLQIPHPQMHLRAFVLRPLTDIAPQFYHPVLRKDTRNLVQECRDKSALNKASFKLFKSQELLFSQVQFMAIEGNIGAGKTTLAKKIASDFNAKLVLERFADNPFLPKFYEDQARYAFPLEMSFLADRYQQFMDDTAQYDLFKSFMISDYDVHKSLIFAKITLQQEEFNLYRKVFGFMYKEVVVPKMYVYLHQNTVRLLENIKKRGRTYEQNIEEAYLEKIQHGYMNFIKSYPEKNVLILDVSNLDFIEEEKDYTYILDELQKFVINQQI
ncbi:2-amino-4-hydroxy-6-hydroxymethyldihydropteridine diphosphokinase [Arenibacter sp. GZD96]|uniref:2-amino-4-hydroxy-6- hydroxymethyldihydropteridine diphosphokinase n=1 Tax=Aurantibrevibacter litoralis TaxID=3106030 RepID=UPI002AFFCC65|nr:2-amino-4-hydroxy-6-hydroxymethyldihydropteridine diphosphokinase [Arenibacter sp. GZD-96]MEA1784722.1 2-amino-4-hydroxy-6-hydroxymethyldihydropteridine diphosphokinase [Arenibacter sp. GZD-96]